MQNLGIGGRSTGGQYSETEPVCLEEVLRRQQCESHALVTAFHLELTDVEDRLLVDEDEGATAEQREGQFPHGGVEGQVGELQDTVVDVLVVQGPEVVDEVHQSAVPEHDTLGHSGGSGSVDDVGEVTGTRPVPIHDLSADGGASWCERFGNVDDSAPLRQRPLTRAGGGRPSALDQHRPGIDVVGHVPDPLSRVLDIERHVTGAREQRAHEGDNGFRATLAQDPDCAADAHPGRAKRCGDAEAAGFELPIGESLVAPHEGGTLRILVDDAGEHVNRTEFARVLDRAPVEGLDDLLFLALQQATQVIDALLFIRGELIEHCQHPVQDARDLGGGVAAGVVQDDEPEFFTDLLDCQVKFVVGLLAAALHAQPETFVAAEGLIVDEIVLEGVQGVDDGVPTGEALHISERAVVVLARSDGLVPK